MVDCQLQPFYKLGKLVEYNGNEAMTASIQNLCQKHNILYEELKIIYKYFRAKNKQTEVTYYGEKYGRKSKNSNSSFIEFIHERTILYGELKYFWGVSLNEDTTYSFAVVKPLTWNNCIQPYKLKKLNRFITDKGMSEKI